MSRGPQSYNPNRKGGRNLWTDEEMRTLEGGFDDLVTRLPGRASAAVAHKLMHLVRDRAETQEDQT